MEIFRTPRWELLLEELVAPVKEDFDYIIVDSPNWLICVSGVGEKS